MTLGHRELLGKLATQVQLDQKDPKEIPELLEVLETLVIPELQGHRVLRGIPEKLDL